MSSGQNGSVRESRVYPVRVSRGPDRPMSSSSLTRPNSFDPSNVLTTLNLEAFHDRHANLCLCCGKPIAFPAGCCRVKDCKDCHRNSCSRHELKGRVGQHAKGCADYHHPFELVPANIVPSGGRPVEPRCTIVANINNHVAQGKPLFTRANLRMIDQGLKKITLHSSPDMQVQVKDIRGKTTNFTLSLGAAARRAAVAAPRLDPRPAAAVAAAVATITAETSTAAANVTAENSITTAANKDDGSSSTAIQCYVQDPAYNEIDKASLGQAGVEVLDDPRGFLKLNSASVVVGIALDFPLKQIVADIARPAVIIWDKYCLCGKDCIHHSDRKAKEGEDDNGSNPMTPRVAAMLKVAYNEVKFPGNEFGAFGDLAIYIHCLSAKHKDGKLIADFA
ncbi:hypothetical protein B0T24DRAFT_699162 [Lasiosphaeria ovina]|uniref:SRR1-like domain-containing protein n=1 Tax=Lasiosphaeria ovina TaxID=92902 RepID=A0AAE0KHU4_9PEZI|nr:hypothetical protein B0T24DRAFT_699162 [Lasiosphaeria ovina]